MFGKSKIRSILPSGSKELLRQHFLSLRDEFATSLTKEERSKLEEDLSAHLRRLFENHKFKSGLAYRAMPAEISTDHFVFSTPQYQWGFPKVEPDTALTFFLPQSQNDFLVNRWGIHEPDPGKSAVIPIESADVILVPGVAFDHQGNRLGYGRGYYDRALAKTKAVKVGVCFSVQVSHEDIVPDSHDIPMDFVVTEKFVLQPVITRRKGKNQ